MLLPRRFRAVLPFAAALIGCNPSPTHAPAASPYATPEPPPIPTGPSIVGRITLSSTKEPPRAGVVYLEDAPKQPGTLMTATINVDHKNFTPFIGVVTTGGTVTFGNLDVLTHHVFSPDIKDFDTGFLRKGDTSTREFDKPGPVALLCNVHPEMLGYVMVIPSTYYGTINVDGTYAIRNVPAGTFKATAWVPRMPAVTRAVAVGDADVTLDFTMPREGE